MSAAVSQASNMPAVFATAGSHQPRQANQSPNGFGEALGAAGSHAGQTEAGEVVIADEQRPIRPPHLQFQIPKAVERIRASAGGDAAAVLRPRRGVLNVPELTVAGADTRHGVR